MTVQARGDIDTETKPGKQRRALFTAMMFVLIAIPAVVLLIRVARVAGPYIKQPAGVIVKPAFLEEQSDYYMSDPVIGHIHRPNVQREVTWDEHPEGRVIMRTNNLGFREDTDTDVKKRDDTVRILVTGDSHIDGVVDNSESFPNRLEALLNSSGLGPTFEVINGGTGYYGPQHYSRFIEKYESLDPDAFIVVIYTGNDFLDAVRIESQHDSTVAAGRDLGTCARIVYFGRLAAARRISHGVSSQGLNQAFFFKRFPKMKAVSLRVTKREISRIEDTCRQAGTDLYLVLLPTSWSLGERETGWGFEASRMLLGLDDSDLRTDMELSDSLGAWLERKGIDHIDMADCTDADPDTPLFWISDSHLNVNGHRLLAEEVSRAFDWSGR